MDAIGIMLYAVNHKKAQTAVSLTNALLHFWSMASSKQTQSHDYARFFLFLNNEFNGALQDVQSVGYFLL